MKNIRKLRKHNNMTMKQLGILMGCSESTICQYETGKRRPGYETLLKFCDIFGVTADEMLRDVDVEKAEKERQDIADTEYIGLYNRLPQEQRELILTIMRGMQK